MAVGFVSQKTVDVVVVGPDHHPDPSPALAAVPEAVVTHVPDPGLRASPNPEADPSHDRSQVHVQSLVTQEISHAHLENPRHRNQNLGLGLGRDPSLEAVPSCLMAIRIVHSWTMTARSDG